MEELFSSIQSPFKFSVSFHDDDPALDLRSMLSRFHEKNIILPGGKTRPLHGLIAKAIRGQSTVRSTAYTLELRPWFHFLTLGGGCRLFQNKTVGSCI